MTGNTFKAIHDMIHEEVKEADKKNTAELFKNAFISIKDEVQKSDVEIYDEEFLDGYFIFGFGTNSVVHFKVKGCKHWKFGCWFSYNEEQEYEPLNVKLFFQHERHLDKFKPSYSEFSFECDFSINDTFTDIRNPNCYDLIQFINACKFVKNNYYVGAMKDFYGYDYNYMKQRPIKSFVEYYLDGAHELIDKFITYHFDHIMIRKLNRYAKREFSNYEWEIIDEGEYVSPRYELQVKLPDDDEQETGFFGLFDTEEEQEQWTKLENKLEKAASKFNVYWFRGVTNGLVFWKQKEYEENLKEWCSDND